MSNPDPKDAPGPRIVEPERAQPRASLLAEMFVQLAGRHRHPRQQALLIKHLLYGNGFRLEYTVQMSYSAFTDLARLERRLNRLAKPAKGGGELVELAKFAELAKPSKGGGSHE